ncbi:YgiW/YdeI family stress tolerance OB fold protein [Vibrio sp. E150_011]
MKINVFISGFLTLAVFTSAGAFAQNGFVNAQTSSGFNGNVESTQTVASANEARDESYVTLTGKVTEQVGHELYLFNDETGQVVVEIENEDWHGMAVTPETTLVIQGEVDRGWTRVKIDVDRMTILNK